MDVDFRAAEVADLEALLALVTDYYTGERYQFDPGRACAALEGILSDERIGRVWLIRDAGTAVGYLVVTFGYSIEYHGRDAFVDELFVQESHRGRGLGTRALEIAEAECRRLGVNALHLEVERDKSGAQRLYSRAGFASHDRYLLTKRLV